MPRPANALIVDDEPHVLVLLKGILKQLGIETVWEALDGTEALSKASINKPDVVLLDINLPEVNGLQVLAQLKADHPKMPVIIVSSQGTLKTFDRARELGAAGYVLKFAPKSEILRMLSEVFYEIAAPPVTQAAEGGEAPPKESGSPGIRLQPSRYPRPEGGWGRPDGVIRQSLTAPEVCALAYCCKSGRPEILPCPSLAGTIGSKPLEWRGA